MHTPHSIFGLATLGTRQPCPLNQSRTSLEVREEFFYWDENDVVDRLVNLNPVTKRETVSGQRLPGLKQVVRDPKLKFDNRLALAKS